MICVLVAFYHYKHKMNFHILDLSIRKKFTTFFLLQIPLYKGATEALIPGVTRVGTFHGANGFCDVEFWHPNVYPNDIDSLVQRKHAVEIIRDLILEVRFL